MKKILTLVAVLGATLALTTIAPAQAAGPQGGAPGGKQGGKQGGKRGGGQRGPMAKRNQEIFAKLNLTAAQKERIKALQERTMKAMRELREQNKGADRKTLGPKMREIHQGFRKDLLEILTPTQRDQYKTLVKEAMKKRREEREKQKGTGGGF